MLCEKALFVAKVKQSRFDTVLDTEDNFKVLKAIRVGERIGTFV